MSIQDELRVFKRLDDLRAENERLKEELHYCNGCCDLAMKHRDIAEAEIERLKAALEQAVAAEREACEQAVEKLRAIVWRDPRKLVTIDRATAAIRARAPVPPQNSGNPDDGRPYRSGSSAAGD